MAVDDPRLWLMCIRRSPLCAVCTNLGTAPNFRVARHLEGMRTGCCWLMTRFPKGAVGVVFSDRCPEDRINVVEH